MAHERYPEGLHTPGDGIPKGKTIIMFDQAAYADMTAIERRYRELAAQLGKVRAELDQAQKSLGKLVAEGQDPSELGWHIADLRMEVEALEAGLTFVKNKGLILERLNPWMK
jgi:hypothetical protein